MKTKLLIVSLILSVFILQAQNRNRVNTMNNEISDNLDLRTVADIFGASINLQEFERQLNDPKFQISNLDLNNDNQVDYLRVIETVKNRIHVIIIQSVLDRYVYQDIATIEIEKDRDNTVHIQVVGNEYMYGQNYIYEPIYYIKPVIYNSLWSYNYSPYVSNWSWDYYPSYYYTWNPFSVFRYRNNIQIRLNSNNYYNYVNNKRSEQAVVLYLSRRSNGYERQHPNATFSRRNNNVPNRYELEQKRRNKNTSLRNEVGYSNNRNQISRINARQRKGNQRNVFRNSSTFSKDIASQRDGNPRTYSDNSSTPDRETASQRNTTVRDYSQNRSNLKRKYVEQRIEARRDNVESRNNSLRKATPQGTNLQKGNTTKRINKSRGNVQQRAFEQKDSSKKSK
jgi:hypothetical protein